MNTQIVAILIQEGSRMVGQWLRTRPIRIHTISKTPLIEQAPRIVPPVEPVLEEIPEEYSVKPLETEKVATGCIPCAIGHLGTCAGLLSEADRFARSSDIYDDEVTDRVGKCLDELNTMERVDLAEENIVNLPLWEKELAGDVLTTSRAIRHQLESIESFDNLEKTTADAQITRKKLFRSWIKGRMENMTPEEQAVVNRRIIEKLNELESKEEQEEVNEP